RWVASNGRLGELDAHQRDHCHEQEPFHRNLHENFFDYLPIIRIVNEPGIGAPRAPRPPPGGGGGAGPRSSLIVKMCCVLLSNVIVRAPFIVCRLDRKSTRLNSSHQIISYAVFCLTKKNE